MPPCMTYQEQELGTTYPRGFGAAAGDRGVPGWPGSPFLTLWPVLAPNDTCVPEQGDSWPSTGSPWRGGCLVPPSQGP